MLKTLLIFLSILLNTLVFSQSLMLDSTDEQRRSKIDSWMRIVKENFRSNPIKTINYLDSAELLAANYNYQEELLTVYAQKASYYKTRGRISQLKIYAYKAIELTKQVENDSIETHCSRLLALALVQNGQLDKGYEIIDRLIKESIVKDDPAEIAAAFNVRGNYYSHTAQYDLAIEDFSRSRQYFVIAKNDDAIVNINTNIGIAYANLKDYEKSEKYFRDVLEYNLAKNDKLIIGLSYQNMAQMFTEFEMIDSAEVYSKKLLQNGIEVGHAVHRTSAYRYLASIAEKRGNYEEAYDYMTKYTKINDSLTRLANENIVQELEIRFHTQEKQKQIDDVQHLLSDIEKKNNRLSTLFVLCGVFFLVIISVVFIAYRQQNKLNKMLLHQRESIMEKSAVIDVALKEKEVLLKEIHHRVKNNLQIISSLLNLQSRRITDERALSVLDEGKNRIQAIALIHQKLYQNENFEAVNIGEYVVDLSTQLKRTLDSFNSTLEINVNANNVMLDLDTAVPLGLITSELITNSIKHAFETPDNNVISIDIISLEENRYELKYEDNGCGLPEDFAIPMEGSLGTEIIEALTEQLEGKITYGNNDAGGAFFKLIFSQIG